MTEETFDTIMVLNDIADRCVGRIARHPNRYIMTTQDEWTIGDITVGRSDNMFFLENNVVYPTSGFKFLEILAEKYPDIAKKLAKPTRNMTG